MQANGTPLCGKKKHDTSSLKAEISSAVIRNVQLVVISNNIYYILMLKKIHDIVSHRMPLEFPCKLELIYVELGP